MTTTIEARDDGIYVTSTGNYTTEGTRTFDAANPEAIVYIENWEGDNDTCLLYTSDAADE